MEFLNGIKDKHKLIALVLFLFVITNPSISSFKSFLHDGPTNKKDVGKKVNLFICAVFTCRYDAYGNNHEDYYIGVLGNFFKVGSEVSSGY
jgi:hypothetical protein